MWPTSRTNFTGEAPHDRTYVYCQMFVCAHSSWMYHISVGHGPSNSCHSRGRHHHMYSYLRQKVRFFSSLRRWNCGQHTSQNVQKAGHMIQTGFRTFFFTCWFLCSIRPSLGVSLVSCPFVDSSLLSVRWWTGNCSQGGPVVVSVLLPSHGECLNIATGCGSRDGVMHPHEH